MRKSQCAQLLVSETIEEKNTLGVIDAQNCNHASERKDIIFTHWSPDH